MTISIHKSAALLFAGVTVFASCSTRDQDEPLQGDEPVTVTVSRPAAPMDNTIQVSGKIEATETAMISTRVMGFITSIKVKPGDKVTQGKLLATINNADVLARRAQARAMVTEAEGALRDAEKDYERFAELHKQQSASTKEFENVSLNYQSMKAKAEAARQMELEAEAALTYTNLTAPFPGVITQKYLDEGNMANPGVPILAMEQTGSFCINATVSESDIADVKVGSVAEAIVNSSGKILHGKVSEVSPSSQLSGGQYNIKISLPATGNDGLFPGMYVNVSLQTTRRDASSALLIPVSAVVSKDQLTGLYTISENNTALLRWIRLGRSHGDMVEVLSGLQHTEPFIVSSEGKLYNGVPVRVK